MRQGWEKFEFGNKKWDLIVLSYAWVPVDDPTSAKKLCDLLRPSGSIVFEKQLVGEPNKILKVFQKHLRILQYEEVEAASDWDNRNKMWITGMFATKQP